MQPCEVKKTFLTLYVPMVHILIDGVPYAAYGDRAVHILVDTTRRVASATRPPPFFCSHDACGLGTVIVDEKALRVSRPLFSRIEVRIVFCFSQLRVTFPTRRTLREETAILRRRTAILCFLIASDNSPIRNDSLVIEHQSRLRLWEPFEGDSGTLRGNPTTSSARCPL